MAKTDNDKELIALRYPIELDVTDDVVNRKYLRYVNIGNREISAMMAKLESDVQFALNEYNTAEAEEDALEAKLRRQTGLLAGVFTADTPEDQKLMNDSIEYLIESTKINLPSEFLVKWMQLSSEKKITQEEAQAEYDKSEKGMKYQLIESKIIIDNKLQVNFEDLKTFTADLIKNQMLQYGQSVPNEKELDGIVARVMSNKDEIKRLTEQLTSNRILEFFKENFNYKIKKVSYDEYIKEVYPS